MSAVPFHGLRDSFSRIHSTHIIVHISLSLFLFFIYQTRIVLILKYIQRWTEDKLWVVYYEDGIFQVNVDVFFLLPIVVWLNIKRTIEPNRSNW